MLNTAPIFLNNKYLAWQKKGLFLLLNPCPPSLPSPLPSSSTLPLSPHLAGFTCWQWLRHQHYNVFTGPLLNRETSHNTDTHTHHTTATHHILSPQLPPTLWSLLMCCGKMCFSFVFMAFTSVDFLFHWYFCIFYTLLHISILGDARRRHWCYQWLLK